VGTEVRHGRVQRAAEGALMHACEESDLV